MTAAAQGIARPKAPAPALRGHADCFLPGVSAAFRVLCLGVVALAALGTVLLEIHLSGGMPTLFGLWALSPYLPTALALALAKGRRTGTWIFGAVALFSVAFAAWAYGEGFFVTQDAQNALLLLFVPLYQWGAFLVSLMLGAVAEALSVRRVPAD